MKDKLVEFGFDVEPSEVGQACANILAQLIRRRADGLSDDVTVLNYQRMEAGRKLKNIAPATIERRGDKLHISGEVITIHQALVPDDTGKHELDYIRALYEAYAQKLKKDTFTADDVSSLPKRYAENYKEQRMAYYSALRLKNNHLTIAPIIQRLPPAVQRLLGCLTITTAQKATILVKRTKPRRRIALQRGSLMC